MDPRIAAALALTKGATSARRLLARGVSRREIEIAVRRGDLHRVRRGALVEGGAWREAAPWERHGLRARAVAAGLDPEGPVVLSHHSALAVHGISTFGVDDRVHLARLDTTRGRTDAVVSSHRGVPTPFVMTVDGILVVAPAAACLQVAAQFGAEAGLVSMDDGLHRRVFGREELERAGQALAPSRWSRAPAQALTLADPRIESAAESRARWAFTVLGWAQPTPQVMIRDEQDHVVARVDFLFEGVKVVIEIDGMGKYQDVRDLRAEKLREDRLRELGYQVVRLTWADLNDHTVVMRKVLAAVARAA